MSNKKRKQQTARPGRFAPFVLIAGGALLVGAAVWAVWGRAVAPRAAPEVIGAPSLKTDKQKVDLGDVKLGRTVEVSFQLTNVGDRPLEFTDFPYVEVVEGC